MPHAPAPSRRPGARASFTLVEVLVVAAIVGILSALLFPALASARRAAAKTQCAQRLGNYGKAIGLYAADHDMTLPGPVWSEVSGAYGTGNPNRLATFLAPYMGLPSTNFAYAAAFQCPAFIAEYGAAATNWTTYSYLLQRNVYAGGVMTAACPWGIPGTSTPPMKVAALSTADIANTNFWMMSDFDATVAVGASAPTPVHKTYWNRLYFDYHVETVPVR